MGFNSGLKGLSILPVKTNGRVPLINLCSKWSCVVSFTYGCFSLEKELYPFGLEAGWALQPVWMWWQRENCLPLSVTY
jgi:hypothetical protein